MKKAASITTALLFALSLPVLAQTPGNPDVNPGADSPANQNFDLYDTNRDGVLDENEASEGNISGYGDLDADGNKSVDREEFDNWNRENTDATGATNGERR